MQKFYIHFTTIPSRYEYLNKVINSWLNQTIKIKKIIISVIDNSKILDKYKNSKVEIQYLEKDYGPSKKVYGALKYYETLENKNNVYFIICDDDLEYHEDTIKSYLYSISNNKKNIYTHFKAVDRLNILNKKIMHLQGADTYLLNPEFLKNTSSENYLSYLLNIFKECPDAFYQDDYLISVYISIILKLKIEQVKDPKSYNIIHFIDQMHRHPKIHEREFNTIKYLKDKINNGIN